MAKRIRDALLLNVTVAYLHHFVLLGLRYWVSKKRAAKFGHHLGGL